VRTADVSGETVEMAAEATDNEANVDVTNGSTVKPDLSTADVTMFTSSVRPHLVIDNETSTNSTSIDITGLEHYTPYMLKASVIQFCCSCCFC